ncbi:hypothetical protein HNO89_003644 [Sporosarcina luteola]|nr:hypothetical protein [Sporosarcina luteola]
MHKELWHFIKLFAEKDVIDSKELASAEGRLDREEFILLKEQLENGLKSNSEQWV